MPRTRQKDQIRKDIEIIVKNGKKCNKTESGRMETTGVFSVIVDPYLWRQLKIDDGNDDVILNRK